MAPQDSVLDRAIEHIADGDPVDWDVLESGEQREWLACLQILQDIVRLHRFDDEQIDATLAEKSTSSASASPTGEAISDRWGRYRLDEKVGEGSFGRVYRAW